MLGQSSLPSSGTNVNLGVVESVAKTGSLLTGHRVFRRPLIIGPNSPLPNNPSPQPSDQYCIAGSDRTDHFPQSRFWVPGFRATTKPLIHVRGHYTNVFVHFYIVFVHCLYCICSSFVLYLRLKTRFTSRDIIRWEGFAPSDPMRLRFGFQTTTIWPKLVIGWLTIWSNIEHLPILFEHQSTIVGNLEWRQINKTRRYTSRSWGLMLKFRKEDDDQKHELIKSWRPKTRIVRNYACKFCHMANISHWSQTKCKYP